MNNEAEVTRKQAHLVDIAVVVFTRELGRKEVQQHRVPMTAQQAMSLFNFVKHRLHGGRLRLEGAPEEKRIITL
jgi:hypothetical protein